MTLAFDARTVDCADALDGEILHVRFDSAVADQEEEERSTPYSLISRNFEFAGPATIEWHDGQKYDGGAKIVSATLRRARISIQVDRELNFDVSDEPWIAEPHAGANRAEFSGWPWSQGFSSSVFRSLSFAFGIVRAQGAKPKSRRRAKNKPRA